MTDRTERLTDEDFAFRVRPNLKIVLDYYLARLQGNPMPNAVVAPPAFERVSKRKYLYVVARPRDGAIKIGVSRNVAQRVHKLDTTLGEPVHLLAAWEGSYQDERAAHRYLAAFRAWGEWFLPLELGGLGAPILNSDLHRSFVGIGA